MPIIRWNPWSIDNVFDDEGFEIPTIPGLSRLGQGLNLYETKDAVIAELALPGVSPDKIDVTVEDGLVRVIGSQQEKREGNENARYFMNSLSASYNYAFRLPKDVDQNIEPEAMCENGMVRLEFPKTKKAEPKRISVKAKQKESKAKEKEV